eukprot:scaffold18738_cov57-Attheya_sp.AAC.1
MLPEERVLIAPLEGEEDNLASTNPPCVAGCLVDYQRRMQRLAAAHVDCLDTISADSVMERSPRQSANRYAVIPVTAKHNLRQASLDGHTYFPVEAKLQATSGGRVLVESDDFGWAPGLGDRIKLRPEVDPNNPNMPEGIFGLDLSLGKVIDSPEIPVTQPFFSFSLVRKTFKPEIHQKVGIAIIFTEDSKPTEKTIQGCGGPVKLKDFDENLKMEDIYGTPGQVNIYTGKITYVSDYHIEYDINTFSGCSGAVVFLLDQNQPEGVHQCDWGKAIVIHSSGHPSRFNRNYGFLLHAHPELADITC